MTNKTSRAKNVAFIGSLEKVLVNRRGVKQTNLMQSLFRFTWRGVFLLVAGGAATLSIAAAEKTKPVFLYSRYFNAEGEQRYLPDGNYKDVLDRLRADFDVRVHNKPLTAETLADVNVVLIANPSDKAVGANPPPHHFTAKDIEALTKFVERGGGLFVMANQENHNFEIEDTNKLLARFGIQFTNLYTDAKLLALPKGTPVIGGLRWGYYTGNLLLLDKNHSAKPRSLATNDLKQKPAAGTRDQNGVLMAAAQPGKGHVIVVTDAGWITEGAFKDEGIGGVALKGQENWDIFRRLALWASGR
jgi:hypothetical protein